MKQVHWAKQNCFLHYGGAGLNMLATPMMGFRQEFNGGFRFDDVAQAHSFAALTTLPKNITQRGQQYKLSGFTLPLATLRLVHLYCTKKCLRGLLQRKIS
jgi:hypothetical protein